MPTNCYVILCLFIEIIAMNFQINLKSFACFVNKYINSCNCIESSRHCIYIGAAYHSQVGIHSNYKICIYALRACAHNGRHYFEIYKYIKRKAYRADRQAICNILSVLLRRPLTKRFSQNNSAESTTPHGTVVKFVYNEEIIFFLYFYIYLCIYIFCRFLWRSGK